MSKSKKYVPLHVHTDYSYRDSICKIKPLVVRAKELGYEALAMTDHGHIAGALQFYKECRKQGIKPILGVEAYIVKRTADKDRSASHITLLAMNNVGWENLIKLLSWANEHGFYYNPRIDIKQLFKHHEGIIVLSGCMQSLFAKAILENNIAEAERLAREFQAVFGDRFYFEVQMVNRPGQDYIPEQNIIMKETRKLGKKLGIACVATNDIHYIHKDDKLTHDIWKAISSKRTLKDPPRTRENPTGRMVFNGYDYYLQTYDEMCERFARSEVTITADIAKRCEITLEFQPGAFMPRYDNNMSDDEVHELLRQTCKRRIREGRLFSAKDTEYVERAKKELKDIQEANLAHYFMIVNDLVAHADKEGIPRGWGRGSVGGSLVAYSLGITRKIDPIRYGLVWERFYNKGRKGSMPDIDLDFCVNRRKEIIAYLRDRFGHDRIYPMSTIHALAGKMAIKDVGRAIGLEFSYLNMITRLFPHKCDSIADGIERVPKLKELSDGIDKHIKDWETELKKETDQERKNFLMQRISERKTQLKMLFQHAMKLEDCKRHKSTHACALVIADRSLVGQIPLIYDTGNKELVTAWDMYDIEDLGYLKLDVLGLKAITAIEDIRRTMVADGKDPEIDQSESLRDPFIYKMIASGRTTGIFQLESYLGENWARRVKPRNIEEWSDIISLIRPAVLETGMADQYATARRTGHIEYVHDALQDILRPTQGVMLYQEQTIHLARVVAGFSLERADVLRHAVGKKKKDEMTSLKDEFLKGCQKHGKCSSEEADKLWALVEAGAGYGFNRCVSGDTCLKRGGNGHNKDTPTIAHLYNLKNDLQYAKKHGQISLRKKIRREGYGQCLALDGDGRIRPRSIKDIMYSGHRRVCKITLSDGRIIKATPEHKFFSTEGFVPVKEFKIGTTKLVIDGDYELTDFKKSNRFSDILVSQRVGKYTNKSFTKFQASKSILQNIDYCQRCGVVNTSLEHHHIDGNRNNSSIKNIEKLCNSCHKKSDYEIGKRKKRWTKGHKTTTATVVDIKQYAGWEDVYDIEMDTAEHNWLANGIVTSNSHSIEYSFVGYVMAYYKFKHPIYFYKSMLEMAASEQKTREEINKLYYDALRYGINVKAPSLDLCNAGFEIHDGRIYYGFQLIKSIGKSHMNKIKQLRDLESAHDLRTRIVDRNIGKGTVLPLLYSGALDTIVGPRRRLNFAIELELFYGMTRLRQHALLKIEERLAKEGVSDAELFKRTINEWMNEHGQKLVRNPRLNDIARRVIAYKITAKDALGVAEKEREYLGVCITCCEADFYRKKRTKAHYVGTVLSSYGNGPTTVLACVTNPRYIKSKKGNDVIIAEISDTTGKMTAMLIGDAYDRNHRLMNKPVLYLKGTARGTQFMIDQCKIPGSKAKK